MARDFSQLPEEMLSHIISFTTPRDACVASAVSRAFLSAADSDSTWKHFLPPDYTRFLTVKRARKRNSSCSSKKKLYFRLCDRPLLNHHKSRSFGLDKSTGAKIFMISSLYLQIDEPWIVCEEWQNRLSRFRRCSALKGFPPLLNDPDPREPYVHIWTSIEYEILTPNISYAAYLVFKLNRNEPNFGVPFQQSKVTVGGADVSQHSLCLNPAAVAEDIPSDVILPRRRQDGWLEVELGAFNTTDVCSGTVKMSFKLCCELTWKHRLTLDGIEIKPRY